jgi:hypothetical protein
MGSLRRQPNCWLTGLVAAVLGVLLSVAGCGAGGSEPGHASTAPSGVTRPGELSDIDTGHDQELSYHQSDTNRLVVEPGPESTGVTNGPATSPGRRRPLLCDVPVSHHAGQ